MSRRLSLNQWFNVEIESVMFIIDLTYTVKLLVYHEWINQEMGQTVRQTDMI